MLQSTSLVDQIFQLKVYFVDKFSTLHRIGIDDYADG
jgi:hypothetical protein